MKLNLFNHFMQLLAAFICAAAITACQSDPIESDAAKKADEKTITLSINVPGADKAASRGLTDVQENHVEHIDVLVFDTYDMYAYTAQGTLTGSSGNKQETKTFTVTLRQGNWRLVVLANARAAVLASQSEFAGVTRVQLFNRLIHAMPTDKWYADASQPFPMWGQVNNGINTHIDEYTNLTSNPTKLHRMVSRVDVIVSTPKFTLQSVRVYNYHTRGHVAPDISANAWNGNAVRPYIVPQGYNGYGGITRGPLVYQEINSTTNSCTQEIYILEGENLDPSNSYKPKDLLKRTCLVVGGRYQGDNKDTYYRVDFSTGNGVSQTYLDVLRNHQYIFKITDVKGSGFEQPQEAFESLPVNIETSVVEWNNGDISDIVFDGQYLLGVSPANFTFSQDEINNTRNDNYITIFTDYPTGWQIEGPYDNSGSVNWLRFNSSTGSAGSQARVYLYIYQNNGNQREAYFYVKAGRLKYKVTVTQQQAQQAAGLSLKATDNTGQEITEMLFWAKKDNTPAAQRLNIIWTPATAKVQITHDNNVRGFSATGLPPIGTFTDYAGTRSYNIQPIALSSSEVEADPFLSKSLTLNLSASDGTYPEYKSVVIRQVHYSIVVAPEKYDFDGQQKSFYVRSNTQWAVKGYTGDISLNISQSGGNNTGTGDIFYFIPTSGGGSGTITFYDPTNRADEVTVTIQKRINRVCGTGGTPVVQQIGNTNYKTHVYGTGSNQRCWMVQNYAEGADYTKKFYGYGNGIENYKHNGSYYTYEEAKTARPLGWHIPTQDEVLTLIDDVRAESSVGAKWWFGGNNFGALAGRYSVNNYTTGWNGWGSIGIWWSSGSMSHFIGSMNTFIAGGGGFYTEYHSLRFVQDID